MGTKKGMKTLFEGSKEEIAHSRRILKLCLDQSHRETIKSFDLAMSSKDFKLQMETGSIKLLLDFVQMYSKELMLNFGNQLMIILNGNEIKREGDLSVEEKEQLASLTKAEERKKILEEALFETFIVVSS